MARLVGAAGAGTGTMEGALVQAYQNNPQLNAQRAATRAVDENVPTALSGYRPARHRDRQPDRAAFRYH